jgi:hypothetical protein
METLERNLLSLTAELFDKGKAKRGYDIINLYIETGKDKELAYLLRDHNVESVYGEELIKRFEIDTLLEFYNLLFIAAVTGYVPYNLNKDLNDQVIKVLSHPSVKPYYETYYPYRLVEYTLKYVTTPKPIPQASSSLFLAAFSDFLSINRMLRRDKDIEVFRNLLDFVWYDDDVNLNSVIKILSSAEAINKAITAKEKNAESKAIWGFFKYTAFISQFRELLQSIEENKLLQSVMWMFHGYYLERMNKQMKDFFTLAFKNMEDALADPALYQNIALELYGVDAPVDFDEDELRAYAAQAVEQSKVDVSFILSNHWKNPIETFFS